MNLTEALKYAAKPRATAADYHKAFDRLAADPKAEQVADGKVVLPTEFFTDYLRSEGHHPQADLIDQSIRHSKEQGEPVVYSESIDQFPPHHREILESLGQGDFHLVLGKPNSDYTNAALYQRSHTDPSKVFGWTDSIEGSPDEVKTEVERFQQAGVPVELAMGPDHKDYPLWAKHFGLHSRAEQEPEFDTEGPEQYAKKKAKQRSLSDIYREFIADTDTEGWSEGEKRGLEQLNKAEEKALERGLLSIPHQTALAAAYNFHTKKGNGNLVNELRERLSFLKVPPLSHTEGDTVPFDASQMETDVAVSEGQPVKVIRTGYHNQAGVGEPMIRTVVSPEGKALSEMDLKGSRYSVLSKALKYINETHSDFHNRILENPAETTPALVYADWLEEQGMPAHAEVIRRSVSQFGDAASVQHRGTEYLPNSTFHPHQTTGDHWYTGDGRSVVNLFQATDRPETGFGWAAEFDSAEEANKVHADLLKEGAFPHNHRVRVGFHQPATVGKVEEPADPVSEHFSVADALKYINETHSDFHNRILENPAETTPALVYADWLEENGKPAHAELIRKHVEQSGTGANHHFPRQVPYVYGNELSYHPHEMQVGLTHSSNPEGRDSYISLEAGQKDPSHSLWWDAYLPPEQAADLHKRIQAEGAPVQDEDHTALPTGWKRREGGLETEEAVAEHFSAAEKPIRYSAVPSHEIHPDYAPNGVAPRVGHLLGQLATEDSDAGALAEGILRTGSHDILPILADRLDETGHPLAQEIDWRHTPRAIRIDRALHREIGKRQVRHPDGHRVPLTAAWVLADMQEGIRRPAFSKRKALLIARLAQPDATNEDVAHSLFRLSDNNRYRDYSERLLREPETLTDPTTGEIQLPIYLSNLTQARLQRMGYRRLDPFRYTDLRAEGNRKYAAFKAPAGGMVVKQSPLAVSGQWAEGGEFVNDLQKLPTDSVDYKKERKRKRHLVVEYLRKRFRTVTPGTPTEETPESAAE